MNYFTDYVTSIEFLPVLFTITAVLFLLMLFFFVLWLIYVGKVKEERQDNSDLLDDYIHQENCFDARIEQLKKKSEDKETDIGLRMICMLQAIEIQKNSKENGGMHHSKVLETAEQIYRFYKGN